MAVATLRSLPGKVRFPLWDQVMIGLALLSVAFVFADIFFRSLLHNLGIFWTVVWVDLAITAIFALEFLASASKSRDFVGYARANWYDLVGMVPMYAFVVLEGNPAAGGIRLFRLLRVVRIFVAGSRFLRASDMTFGEQILFRILGRYGKILVDFLTTPVLLQGLTMTQQNLQKMRFAEALGRSLDRKRPQIHAAVLETLEKNRVPSTMLSQPMVERVITEVERQVVDQVVDTLTAEQLNLLLQDVVVETIEEFKEQLRNAETADPSGRIVPVREAASPAERPEIRS